MMDDNDSSLKFEHPKWKSSLVENLTVLFKKGELCDLYIMCQDHREANVSFACHACILASASPVIRKLLMKNDIFAAWTKLAIKSLGISATEWQYILKYVYTGTVNIQEPHIYSVWKAALYLQIDILVTVLATCVHKYHYPAQDIDKLPHLKVCPFDTSCLKNYRYLQSADAFIDDQDTSKLAKPLYFDNGEMMKKSTYMKQDRDSNDSFSSNQEFIPSEPSHCDNKKSSIFDSKNCDVINVQNDNKKSSSHRSTLIKTLLMKDNLTSDDFVSSSRCSSEPSATKKRKMYIPRRVQTHGKHMELSNQTLLNLCSSSEEANVQQKKSDSQYDRRHITSNCCITKNQNYITISPDNAYSPIVNESQSIKFSGEPLIIEPYESDKDTKPSYIDTGSHQIPSANEIKYNYHMYEDNRPVNDPCPTSKAETQSQNSVLYGLLHELKQSDGDQKESSVLKSLLISNCNTYRSPERPEHAAKVIELSEEMVQPIRVSSSDDGEEDEYFNDRFAPDYKPITQNSQTVLKPNRKRKCASEITKNTLKEKTETKISPQKFLQQGNGKNEPYSASSILLSMIKDAGVRKPNTSPDHCQLGMTSYPQKLCSQSQEKHDIHEDKAVPGPSQFKESASFMSTPKGILRNLLKEKGLCADNKSCDSNASSVADEPGLNIKVSTDRTLATQSEVAPVTSLSLDKKLLGPVLPFSNVLQNLALAYNSATKAKHEGSLLKHMLNDRPKKIEFLEDKKPSDFRNKSTNMIDISNYDNKCEDSEIPRSPNTNITSEESEALKLTIRSDFKVKQEIDSPSTNDKSKESGDMSDVNEFSVRYVLNVPSMGNTSNTVCDSGPHHNKLKVDARNEAARKIQIMDVQSMPHKEFEQMRSKESPPDSFKDTEGMENDNIVLNLSVRNQGRVINAREKGIESSAEGSDNSDVEVAQFSGLQSADSAVSVSDSEVAEDKEIL